MSGEETERILRSHSKKEDNKLENQVNANLENINAHTFQEKQVVVKLDRIDEEHADKMTFNLDLAIKIIPEFDGNGQSGELHKFIRCCELVYKPINTDPEKKKFLEFIPTRLCGLAYDITQYKEYKTWDELKLDLKCNFSKQRPHYQILNELMSSKQNRNESVRDFANRVEKLLANLNEVAITNFTDKDPSEEAITAVKNGNNHTALKAFERGLNREIGVVIRACRFDKLKDAISKANEEELCFYPHDEQSISKPKNKYQNIVSNHSNLRCHTCNKIGHTSNVCYSKQSFSNARVFKPNVNNAKVICEFCKNFGHVVNDCRKKAFYEAQGHSQSLKPTNSKSIRQFSSQLPAPENLPRLEDADTITRVQDL